MSGLVVPTSRQCTGRGCGFQTRSENRRCPRSGIADDFCGSHSGERARLGHTTQLRLLRRRRGTRVPCRDVSDEGLWQSFRTGRNARWFKSSHSTVGMPLRLPRGLVPDDLPGRVAVDDALWLATDVRCTPYQRADLRALLNITRSRGTALTQIKTAVCEAHCARRRCDRMKDGMSAFGPKRTSLVAPLRASRAPRMAV
jgi:hypothetical protein